MIGLMALEMIGGVYCPLSPYDPEQRLHTLIKETKTRLVLVDQLTKDKLKECHFCVDIERFISENSIVNNMDVDTLSKIEVNGENIAYVIFTSGSTGIPKAVSIFRMTHSPVFCSCVNKLSATESSPSTYIVLIDS